MESYCSEDYAADYAAMKIKEKFDQFHLNKYMKFPNIIWEAYSRCSAGYTNFDENSITLNTNYLYSKDWDKFLDETPLHELAHLMAYHVHNSTGHSPEWKNCCRLFGLKGNRCHSFADPENIKQRQGKKQMKYYTVYCPCMEHHISQIRYKRMQLGEEYICAACNKPLTFKKAVA